MKSNSLRSANYFRNLLVAVAAMILTSALFFSLHNQNTEISLKAAAQSSTPLEVAQINNRPTVIEFYADWCPVCQSLAGDNIALQKQYAGRINFVMLNIDNNKWMPEVERYKVDGIPHFEFLNSNKVSLGNAVGAIPKEIVIANLEAMLINAPLPNAGLKTGETSAFTAANPADTSNPTDHR